MATINLTMQATGNEPQTCNRPFVRGEAMMAIEYDDGEPAGWHTKECVEYWKKNDVALCADAGQEGGKT